MDEKRRDRTWLTLPRLALWALSVAAMVVAGGLAWLALGGLLCKDSISDASDPYCNGGWELSGVGVAVACVAALVLPGVAVALGRPRLFAGALALAMGLLPVEFVLSVALTR